MLRAAEASATTVARQLNNCCYSPGCTCGSKTATTKATATAANATAATPTLHFNRSTTGHCPPGTTS